MACESGRPRESIRPGSKGGTEGAGPAMHGGGERWDAWGVKVGGDGDDGWRVAAIGRAGSGGRTLVGRRGRWSIAVRQGSDRFSRVRPFANVKHREQERLYTCCSDQIATE